jgi:hypothetical protein
MGRRATLYACLLSQASTICQKTPAITNTSNLLEVVLHKWRGGRRDVSNTLYILISDYLEYEYFPIKN